MSVALIKKFCLDFDVSQLSDQSVLHVLQNLTFGPVSNLLIKEDSYTPNNDYFWLWQNIPAGEAPNFIYFQTDNDANLSVAAVGGTMLNALPVHKMHLLMLPPNNPYMLTNIYLEGRLGQPSVMPQGVPVNFLAIMAQVSF